MQDTTLATLNKTCFTDLSWIFLQAPLLDPLGSPLTGYLLQNHVYDNTSTIAFLLNTSYTLDSVPSGVVYTITVSALSDVGPSKNNPSVHVGETSILHNNQQYCKPVLKFACFVIVFD